MRRFHRSDQCVCALCEMAARCYTAPIEAGAKQPEESHIRHTAHTKFVTGAELKNASVAGKVRLLDPCDYATKLSEWKFVINCDSSLDYYPRDPWAKATDELKLKMEEIKLQLILLSKGVYHMIQADYDLPFELPDNVERCAFLHDMGTLYGIYVRKLDGKAATLTALAMLSDDTSQIGTGDIIRHAQNSRLPDRPTGVRKDTDERISYYVQTKGGSARLEYHIVPSERVGDAVWMRHRKELERALGWPVVFQWDGTGYTCNKCGHKSEFNMAFADATGRICLFNDNDVSETKDGAMPVLTNAYCGDRCFPLASESKRLQRVVNELYEKARANASVQKP